MKIAATAIALLAATSIAAYAQGTAPAPKATTNSDQCWDMASNSIKNSQAKSATQGANTSAGATGPATNPTTTPAPGGMAKSDSPANSMAQARPAGMPNC